MIENDRIHARDFMIENDIIRWFMIDNDRVYDRNNPILSYGSNSKLKSLVQNAINAKSNISELTTP
jgi:hypothetical protein